MPNSPLTLVKPDLVSPADKSTHYEHVKNALPTWLAQATPRRIVDLKSARLDTFSWQKDVSDTQHQILKKLNENHWTEQNAVDRMLSGLQDLQTFAEPLLRQALVQRYGVDVDVNETWLCLYAPAKTPWWVHDVKGGVKSLKKSLLDAALHNFANSETYTVDSEFISRPDARGHFRVEPLRQKITITQFIALCRELDIGAQYQKHLNDCLKPKDGVAQSALQFKVIRSQKSALAVAAQMALAKKDISAQAYDVVLGMLYDSKDLQWNGKPVGYHTLWMMDAALTGIVVITAELQTSGKPVPVIVYVPNDPEHPLKEYPSSLEFMAELTRQLRDTSGKASESYQQFFSQFVAHQQRGHFFAGLNDRLSTVKWQPVPSGSGLPSWRETPVNKPGLQFALSKIEEDRQTRFTGNLWPYLYQQKLNKIFNDAREIAIPTEYADRMARWAWWDNLEKILSDILNAALLVATPLLPGLGELMLAYTAYQLTSDVVEGIVDLAEGRWADAAEQTINVLQSVVQLGAFAGGAALGKVVQAKLSPFFEGLQPVHIPGGQRRLWNPDLAPYQRLQTALPTDAKPDASGIYQHQGQRIVRLDDQHFVVDNDPVTGQHRIKHPQRPDAYAPRLKHNGHGAWVAETENPRLWQGPTLMRRLGHTTDAFNDVQLEQVRQISGTDEAELRRVHVDNAPPPPLLVDTLQRLDLTAEHAAAELKPETALLFLDFPELPGNIAEKILAGASVSERQRIAEQHHLSMRLKTQARELQFETQSVRAAQGLYHDALTNIDTERLVLGALRIHTDTFADLRIEIREDTVDGVLRCSAGSEDSSLLRILVRDESAQYTVWGASNQRLHGADNLFESVLHALNTDQRRALGYKPGDAEMFKEWIIAKTAPPSERRTVLARPPLRPIGERETMLLVRGAGLSRDGQTLHERIQDLHPHFSEHEVDAFADALSAKGEPLKIIEQHEDDLDELRVILNRWEYQQPDSWGPGSRSFQDAGGLHISERLMDCFTRKNTELGNRADPDSYSLDLSRELLSIDLELWWKKRPDLKKFLDKVTVLKLDNTLFSFQMTGLLKDFPNLHELSAKGCELTRLPNQIGNLPRLQRLRLSDNKIVLDADDVEKLKQQTRLEVLRLDENPLGRLVDIGHMPRLKVVGVRNTGLASWPKGTLKKSRPRGFLLDLRGNPLEQIPDVVPGSAHAWVVARTRLDVSNLSDINQVLYQQVRQSVALPPEPIVPADNPMEATITSNYSTTHWNDVPGWGVDRANLWSDLIDEPQAERFMTVLLETKNSADYRAGGDARDQLLQRIWRMLDAVQIDTPLRQELFTMAIAPVDCADAGAQLFNNMGIKVLASEASSYSTDAAQREQKLVTLAKGAARLEHVNDIARADIAGRQGNPDDVEVYLAYQTGLAQRLGLPWQSERMLYRPVSGVTDAMIDQACDTVLALEEGDGLVNKMLEQDFWEQYLKEKFPIRIETNKRLYQSQYEQLETLRTTQLEWADSSELTQTQRAELNDRLKVLANDLAIAQTLVFTEDAMSETTFESLLVDLGYQEKNMLRSLTREALSRAGQ
ncbi:NEL-type E3 ubiquitin ligase domain-containing protein [Pseudomonas sp. P1.8]|uniref:NEL-type E3 ubiquitin ligase domain-containing protein n=1 Tax=Pseudomonas sp. P1.8 TaxID=1699310 RepID=UPI00069D320F|nr:NEL-type E3 ubiquitin ligase domain-containing protein [Pseudomonas sp. P1.8]